MTTGEIQILAGLIFLLAERSEAQELTLTTEEITEVLRGAKLAAKELARLELRLRNLANVVIDASINWSGEDEERMPLLKTARTLAGIALDDLRGTDHENH